MKYLGNNSGVQKVTKKNKKLFTIQVIALTALVYFLISNMGISKIDNTNNDIGNQLIIKYFKNLSKKDYDKAKELTIDNYIFNQENFYRINLIDIKHDKKIDDKTLNYIKTNSDYNKYPLNKIMVYTIKYKVKFKNKLLYTGYTSKVILAKPDKTSDWKIKEILIDK